MPDPLDILREEAAFHEQRAARLRRVIAELEQGSTDLSPDEWRARCREQGYRCSVNGEVDSKTFCALNDVPEWQLKKWIAAGIIEPIKRGGRKNYFTVEHFNILRRSTA